MAKFLYGFSVQGISEYIFSSNALREIIGASEIVKKIDALGAKGDDAKGAKLVQIFGLENEPEIILAAAGNLRAVFENEADLKKIVRELPRRVFEFAGEINIAQAVVKFDGDYKKATQELESRLKIQRNKAQFPQIYGFNFLKKYPKTAKPIFISGVDKTTHLKLKECTEFDKTHGDSISNLPEISNYKNKIAIIYADGNGLGQIVKDLDDKQMREFSQKLDRATKAAFQSAKDAVLEDLKEGKNPALTKQGKLKIREVICGGDDLAVICSADIALKLAQNFMREFEKETQGIYKGKNLSVCAGVAFSQHKYPTHYALKLAKDLMKQAKTQSKKLVGKDEIPPSSLLFHNIQSAAVQNFERFVENELTLNKPPQDKDLENKDSRNDAVFCDFGAYYLNPKNNLPTIENFLNLVRIFRDKDAAPTPRLRQWLNMLDVNADLAAKELARINEIYKKFGEKNEAHFSALHKDLSLANLIVKKDEKNKTPIYDLISILSTTAEVFK